MVTLANEDKALAVSTVIIGIISGIGAILLSLLLEVTERLFLAFEETAAQPYAGLIPEARRFWSLAIGGLIAAGIWWWLRRRLKPTVSIDKAIEGQQMPLGTTIVHVMTQIFYVGVGGSVGRELAPRELAAVLAQRWQAWLSQHTKWQLRPEDRQLLIAAAAGAGFAGVYIAPLTGTMFAVEVLYQQVNRRSVVVSLVTSGIATLVGALHKGFTPYYLVGPQPFGVQSLPLVLVIAMLCGVIGAYFRKAFQWANRHQTRDHHLLWQLPLVAMVTGLIAMPYPQIMGNGRALAQTAFSAQSPKLVPLLLIVALLKGVMTVASLRAGASGGTLTPSIGIGAVVGMVVALLIPSLAGGIPLWQAGIIGAATLLAVSQQAPFMAMFMMFEVSHLDHSALLPLALGIGLAMAIGSRVLARRQTQSRSQ